MQRVRTSPGSPAATTALLGTPLHERLAGSSPAERTVCGLMAAPASAAVATMAAAPATAATAAATAAAAAPAAAVVVVRRRCGRHDAAAQREQRTRLRYRHEVARRAGQIGVQECRLPGGAGCLLSRHEPAAVAHGQVA